MQATIRTRIVTEYRTPADALRLNEDIRALERILRELDWIDPGNVAEDTRKGLRLIRGVIGQIKMAERFAQSKMRTEFLAPRKKRMNETQIKRSNL